MVYLRRNLAENQKRQISGCQDCLLLMNVVSNNFFSQWILFSYLGKAKEPLKFFPPPPQKPPPPPPPPPTIPSSPPFLAKFSHAFITTIFEKSHPPFMKGGLGRGHGWVWTMLPNTIIIVYVFFILFLLTWLVLLTNFMKKEHGNVKNTTVFWNFVWNIVLNLHTANIIQKIFVFLLSVKNMLQSNSKLPTLLLFQMYYRLRY